MARYPNEPSDSCPSIDAAIEALEATRRINESLREDARDWWGQVQTLEAQVEILENEVEDLKYTIAQLEKEQLNA